MMRLAVIAASLFSGIGVLWVVNAIWGRHRVNKAIKTAMQEIGHGPATAYNESMLAGLPEPVQRYFRRVLPSGQKFIRFARVHQEAEYKMKPQGEWIDVTADSCYTTEQPALVWDAVLHDSRYRWRRAHLIYLHGTGEGMTKLYGGLTLSDYSGSEADITLLSRFLSEALWFPTALLPSRYIEWKEHGPDSAEAVITDDDLQARVVFHFSATGEVERITTNDKFRDFRGGFHKEEFVMHCRNYKPISNVLVPTELEFVWELDSGNFPYARIHATEFDYKY